MKWVCVCVGKGRGGEGGGEGGEKGGIALCKIFIKPKMNQILDKVDIFKILSLWPRP